MKKKLLFLCILTLLCIQNSAQKYQPTKENLQVRKEFQDSKFGIFVHYGVYSMMADGEWILENKKLRQSDYAKLAEGFYPSNFDASRWVAAFKAAGAKYICFTTRHHDGFSMFDSRYSDYNIVKGTPFRRDIVKELAEECHKQGLKIHFYYSHVDWGRSDYPLGRTGRHTDRRIDENWGKYFLFMNNQLTELLTNYGQVGAIWFDGCWDQSPNFDWHLPEQYSLIHSLQPLV